MTFHKIFPTFHNRIVPLYLELGCEGKCLEKYGNIFVKQISISLEYISACFNQIYLTQSIEKSSMDCVPILCSFHVILYTLDSTAYGVIW